MKDGAQGAGGSHTRRDEEMRAMARECRYEESVMRIREAIKSDASDDD